MKTVTVDLQERSYPIYIGIHTLHFFASYLTKHCHGKKAFIITNEKVRALYLEPVMASFKESGITVTAITIKDGEEYKTQETVTTIYDRLIEEQCERSSSIIALGGGVVGDIAGFVAATFLRGINFVQIPTTLLAQTDSSVGGKVGINHPHGKNMIGAFYQPKFVFIDIDVLKTLERREFIAGLAEVVKYGIIRDADLFKYIEDHIDTCLQYDINDMVHLVETSCRIKADVVREDETEMGVRAILNYGHTFGHAVETLTNYQVYRHGEAVLIGMIIAAKQACESGMMSKEDMDRQNRLIIKLFLPKIDKKITAKKMTTAMQQDKKVENSKICLILPTRIGNVTIVKKSKIKEMEAAIQWFLTSATAGNKKR